MIANAIEIEAIRCEESCVENTKSGLVPTSVGYEHRSLENPLRSLENLSARRSLVLEMLEKISLGFRSARYVLE